MVGNYEKNNIEDINYWDYYSNFGWKHILSKCIVVDNFTSQTLGLYWLELYNVKDGFAL